MVYTLFLILLPGLIYLGLGLSSLIAYSNRLKRVLEQFEGNKEANIRQIYGNAHQPYQQTKKLLESKFNFLLSIVTTIVVVTFFNVLVLVHFRIINTGLFNSELQFLLRSFNNHNQLYFCFAIIGAFIWGIIEYVIQFRNKNLTASALHFIWLKLPVSVIIILAIQQVFNSDVNYLVAFGVGAIPVDIFRKWIKRYTSQKLKMEMKSFVDSPQWNLLQGVTSDIIERLDDVCIENPVQLANADPITLYIKTNIDWRVLLDYIDQSLLISYIGEGIQQMRKIGIRGSIEIAVLWSRQMYKSEIIRGLNDQEFESILTEIMNAAGLKNIEEVKNLMMNIYEDSQVSLIWKLWNTNKTINEIDISDLAAMEETEQIE